MTTSLFPFGMYEGLGSCAIAFRVCKGGDLGKRPCSHRWEFGGKPNGLMVNLKHYTRFLETGGETARSDSLRSWTLSVTAESRGGLLRQLLTRIRKFFAQEDFSFGDVVKVEVVP